MMHHFAFKMGFGFSNSFWFNQLTRNRSEVCQFKLINFTINHFGGCIYLLNQIFRNQIDRKLLVLKYVVEGVFILVSGSNGGEHYVRRIFAYNVKKRERSKVVHSVFINSRNPTDRPRNNKACE